MRQTAADLKRLQALPAADLKRLQALPGAAVRAAGWAIPRVGTGYRRSQPLEAGISPTVRPAGSRVMDHDELRKHIEVAAPHEHPEALRLADLIVSTCWPGGPEDRSGTAARDWIRKYRPERTIAKLPACSCSTGRCVLCN
jgi:hypothetical protein